MVNRLLSEEDGQTLVEYGLLISLIALVVLTALTAMGQRLKSGYNAVARNINTST